MRTKAWQAANPGKVKATRARYQASERAVALRKARRAADHQRVLQREAEYRVANRDKRNAASKAWRAANADKQAAACAAWRLANPEKAAASAAAWRKANPDKHPEHQRTRVRRQRAAGWEAYDDLAIFERDGWRCHLCGQSIDPSLSRRTASGATIDHVIPLSLGGWDAPSNVRAAHWLCNSRRGNRPLTAAKKAVAFTVEG